MHDLDIEYIVLHDFAFGYFFAFGRAWCTPEGFPQGSPLGPALANGFACWKEDAWLQRLTLAQRALFLNYALAARCVDDRLVVWASEQVDHIIASLLVEDFYSEACHLSTGKPLQFIGLVLAVSFHGISCSVPNPYFDALARSELPMILRLTHGSSFGSHKAKTGRVFGHLVQIADGDVGRARKLRGTLAMQCVEALLCHYHPLVVRGAMFRLRQRLPWLFEQRSLIDEMDLLLGFSAVLGGLLARSRASTST